MQSSNSLGHFLQKECAAATERNASSTPSFVKLRLGWILTRSCQRAAHGFDGLSVNMAMHEGRVAEGQRSSSSSPVAGELLFSDEPLRPHTYSTGGNQAQTEAKRAASKYISTSMDIEMQNTWTTANEVTAPNLCTEFPSGKGLWHTCSESLHIIIKQSYPPVCRHAQQMKHMCLLQILCMPATCMISVRTFCNRLQPRNLSRHASFMAGDTHASTTGG